VPVNPSFIFNLILHIDMSSDNSLHLDSVFKHANVIFGTKEIHLKKMGTGVMGAALYILEVPHGMYVTREAQADVIVYASTVPSDPPLMCVGVVPRKPVGRNSDELDIERLEKCIVNQIQKQKAQGCDDRFMTVEEVMEYDESGGVPHHAV
jgi:hypothetical protein